jgi:diguanylate cyclase (GGDEF)-like protein
MMSYGLEQKGIPMGEHAGAVSPSRPPPKGICQRVLVADLEPLRRSLVCATLRANGIVAQVAETAGEILAATEVDTVLLSLNGSLDGSTEERIELIREMRGLGPHRPAVVVMSEQGQASLPRALEAGADDYLITPAGPEELLTRLNVVAERRRLEAEQVMLRRVAVNVATGHERARLFGLVARELALLLHADGGRVVRYLEAGKAELVGAWRRSDLEQIPPGEVLILAPSWALAKVQLSERAARSELTEADALKARAPFRASLAAPVRVEGSLWGAVAVAYAEAAEARQETLVQLERVAELISLAVSNADAREHLARMAKTDPLTGLLNHGAFHQRLDEEVQRAARHGHPLSLALLDLDHFKEVNDQHGHRAGDDALRTVADILRAHARETDILGRVGGEELAWLMPDSELAGAAKAAERLRAATGAAATRPVGLVTASIGVAELEVDGSAGDLFGSADAAMYRAKDAGRNRVRVAQAATSMG